MATTRRAYTGGATSTTTTSAIAASGTTSFTITAYTGWPYGSDPFFIVVEPGTASEEKILVTRTGSTDTTINIASDSERAQDGTSAVAHSSGSIVFPVFTALDADEANELTSSWSTKGDLVSYGSSTFETLGVGADDTVLVADSGETSGLKWSSSLDLSGLAVDTDTLYVDATNDRVGVNDSTPSYALDVTGDINATGDLRIGGTAIGKGQTWTPQVTQSIAFTETVVYSQYWEINDLVLAIAYISISSGTGSAGVAVQISLPTSVDAVNGQNIGSVWIYDSNVTTSYGGQCIIATSNTCSFVGDWAGGSTWGVSPSIAMSTGDQIRISVAYKKA